MKYLEFQCKAYKPTRREKRLHMKHQRGAKVDAWGWLGRFTLIRHIVFAQCERSRRRILFVVTIHTLVYVICGSEREGLASVSEPRAKERRTRAFLLPCVAMSDKHISSNNNGGGGGGGSGGGVDPWQRRRQLRQRKPRGKPLTSMHHCQQEGRQPHKLLTANVDVLPLYTCDPNCPKTLIYLTKSKKFVI